VGEDAEVHLPNQVPDLNVAVNELTVGGSGGTTSFVFKKNGTLTTANGLNILSGSTVSGGAPVFSDVTFGEGSKLLASVCGCDGVIDVAGHVELGGTLAFRLYVTTLPNIGTSRLVLKSTNMSGEFDEIVNETGMAGLKTTTYYTNAGVLVNWDTFLDGDVNVDGTVGFQDLLTLAQNYITPSGATHYNGDLNHDTAVDFADLLILSQGYGDSIDGLQATVGSSFEADWQLALASVPEPTSLMSLALAPLMLRRRRSS